MSLQLTVGGAAAAADESPSATQVGWGRLRVGRRNASWRIRVFPIVAIVGFVALVALGWNQSSSAFIRQQVEGNSSDPAHVFGQPNELRFDEWFVTTSFIVSQDSLDYPQVNDQAMGGTDVSVTSAVPSREWSTAFRPQSWGFFFLPFDQGFAFYWWLPVLLLALGTYALLLSLRPGRPVFAAAGAMAMVFAPFVQWWLLTGTLGCLAWASIILASFIALGRPGCCRRRQLALAGLIAFSTTAFLMLMYPPFQIACGWVVVAAMAGWTFRAGAVGRLRSRLRPLAWAAGAGGVGLGLYVLFLATRWDVVEVQLNTEYPGHRVIPSGSDTVTRFFSGFLDARFPQAMQVIPGALGGNASEASAFLPLGIFLALPAVWLLWRGWRTERVVDGLLVALLGVLGLFGSFLFVPRTDLLAKVTGLSAMEPARLYIGVGLLSLVLTAAMLRELDRQGLRVPLWLVATTGGVALGAFVLTASRIHELSPQLSGDVGDWLPLALVATLIVVLGARGHGAAALAVLAAFSLVATFRVHPLRDGVYDTRDTAIGRAIAETDETDPGRWVSLGSLQTEALLAQQPVDRRSGITLYPVLEYWEEMDPTGRDKEIYNRYALVKFVEDRSAPLLENPDVDDVRVRFDPCGRYAQAHLHHVLADHPVTRSCLDLRQEVRTGSATYFIYDIVEDSG